MKFLSLVQCFGVLIFCLNTVACEGNESVTVDEALDKSGNEINECIGIYLNNKGKLEYEASAEKNASLCLIKVEFVANVLREKFEEKVKGEYSLNNARCVMNEFDSAETMDVTLKILFYYTDDSLPESVKQVHLDGLKNKMREGMDNIQKKCGNSEYIENFLDAAFPAPDKNIRKTDFTTTTANLET